VKVTRQSDSQLVIEERPWLVGLILLVMAAAFLIFAISMLNQGHWIIFLLIAAFGAGIPILLARAMVRRVTLVLDRDKGKITREQIGGGPRQRMENPFSALQKAELDIFKSPVPGEGSQYRLKLVMVPETDRFMFRDGRTQGDQPAHMVKAINHWLGTAP
jgi:hypothetical protein